jgi:hypothetical protein
MFRDVSGSHLRGNYAVRLVALLKQGFNSPRIDPEIFRRCHALTSVKMDLLVNEYACPTIKSDARTRAHSQSPAAAGRSQINVSMNLGALRE